MVIRTNNRRQRGALMTEWAVAMGVLALASLPLAYEFVAETRICRACYQRAVALELIDGEMEVLAAGAWRSFPAGTHPFTVKAGAAQNLPPGEFRFTVGEQQLRLEWIPKARGPGGAVVREVKKP